MWNRIYCNQKVKDHKKLTVDKYLLSSIQKAKAITCTMSPISFPKKHRKSFQQKEKSRLILQNNEILLNKIMNARKAKGSAQAPLSKMGSNFKIRSQIKSTRIDSENERLLTRIQRVKSSYCFTRLT